MDRSRGAGALARALAPLGADRPAGDWHRALHEVLAALGLPERAAGLHGGLVAWAAVVALLEGWRSIWRWSRPRPGRPRRCGSR
ncbi:MAG: hypothetical protein R3F59_30570 [Myxococcota bacterium]